MGEGWEGRLSTAPYPISLSAIKESNVFDGPSILRMSSSERKPARLKGLTYLPLPVIGHGFTFFAFKSYQCLLDIDDMSCWLRNN